ncbi:Dyp-type peroxidase [Mycetocola spongiae]|uniref:Dyp-type peroxidase n=1 Tax=Mycetocola spongiae TaxID=2859226 RepID=UPI001CF4B76E|nr:Dyp-type peroxidase [Mycetocola spongiae]UCR87944.1 Dyp-type peroxidase [Mycetocola spongiae]
MAQDDPSTNRPAATPDPAAPRPGLTRRGLLWGGAVAGVGAVAAIGADLALNRAAPAPAPSADPEAAPAGLHGPRTEPFYGARQSGIETEPQAHGSLLAIDLLPGTTRADAIRLLRILTDDAARLCAGTAALADSEPELARVPSRLTVTFGFGPRIAALAPEKASPEWLRPLPAFGVDRLEERYGDGDLLIQVCADDPLTVAHAVRMLLKDTRAFGTLRWHQRGFRRAHNSEKPGTTMRNLFGQVDGTANPVPGTADFAEVVWINAPGSWLDGGTGYVLRRIDMDLDKWDRLDREGREQSVGRRMDTGAPLTGTREHDEPDFAATTAIGFAVIPEFSHVRRTRMADTRQRIFRRGYNYDEPPTGEGISHSGLLFISLQADVDAQFVPIQRSMDELDLLNEWLTPAGSAVFAIPPGCREGGYIGETLLG